jgi:hypothetical protein
MGRGIYLFIGIVLPLFLAILFYFNNSAFADGGGMSLGPINQEILSYQSSDYHYSFQYPLSWRFEPHANYVHIYSSDYSPAVHKGFSIMIDMIHNNIVPRMKPNIKVADIDSYKTEEIDNLSNIKKTKVYVYKSGIQYILELDDQDYSSPVNINLFQSLLASIRVEDFISSWKTYNSYGISFKYPSTYKLSESNKRLKFVDTQSNLRLEVDISKAPNKNDTACSYMKEFIKNKGMWQGALTVLDPSVDYSKIIDYNQCSNIFSGLFNKKLNQQIFTASKNGVRYLFKTTYENTDTTNIWYMLSTARFNNDYNKKRL